MIANEPMYDDDSLAMFEDIKVAELIAAILEYSKELEDKVLMLRKEINNLTPPAKHKPYEDLYSDVFRVFDHYPAYQKYREHIEALLEPF